LRLVGYEEGKSNVSTKRYNDFVTVSDPLEIDCAKTESHASQWRCSLGPSAVPCVAFRPVDWRWVIGQGGSPQLILRRRLAAPPAAIRLRPTANSKITSRRWPPTGPIFTRDPMSLGMSRLADTRCKVTMVPATIKNGPALPNCRVAARRGITPARTGSRCFCRDF